MNLESYLYGALKRVSRSLAHFEESKMESRPFSPETESPLRCESLEEFRALAGKNNWNFATLKESLL